MPHIVFSFFFFFFNDTATTEIYTLSLHDALPIYHWEWFRRVAGARKERETDPMRSEEHTSELQSRQYLVCRLLLEKKKHTTTMDSSPTMRRVHIAVSKAIKLP